MKIPNWVYELILFFNISIATPCVLIVMNTYTIDEIWDLNGMQVSYISAIVATILFYGTLAALFRFVDMEAYIKYLRNKNE